MPAYKIYRLDAVGGRSTGKDITCPTNDGAMKYAQTMVKGSARAEVWIGEQLLGTAYSKIILMEKTRPALSGLARSALEKTPPRVKTPA